MFKNFEENTKAVIQIIETLIILVLMILATTICSAIGYVLWESLIGNWAFHISRDTFAVVGGIVLCALQLNKLSAR